MGSDTDRGQALRLLTGLENGDLSTGEARVIAEQLDPVLVYLIVHHLRESHPASDSAARVVLERVVSLSADTGFVRQCRQGENDPVSRWFVKEHESGSFRGRAAELIDLIVDKLES